MTQDAGATKSFALGGELTALLVAITSRLIPSDGAGPGAAEANVAGYITRALASEYSRHWDAYALGLAAIDGYARGTRGRTFLDLRESEQDEVLQDIEAGRTLPGGASLAPFFELLLQHTREGMFGDPRWGGNAGNAGWELIGYPGPRFEWTADDQVVTNIDTGTSRA